MPLFQDLRINFGIRLKNEPCSAYAARLLYGAVGSGDPVRGSFALRFHII